MADTTFRDGPAYITDAGDDLYDPASGITAVIRHIHLVNTDSSARTVSLWVTTTGAETAGTEILKDYSIEAKGVYDLYFPAGLILVGATASDILVGDASVTNVVTCTITGELRVT